MTRLKKVKDKNHRLAISGDDRGEMFLVRGGPRRAYLWAGIDCQTPVTISGAAVLRKLAEEILAEVGKR